MAESITLDAPIQPPAITSIQVASLDLDVEHGVIHARLRTNLGGYEVYREQDEDTQAALIALNKANLSVKSLSRRLLERMQAKQPEKWGGVIIGSPD